MRLQSKPCEMAYFKEPQVKPTHLSHNNTKSSCQCTGRVTHTVRATSPRHLSGGSSAGSCSITTTASEWCGINIDEPCATTCGLRSSCTAASSTWLGVVCAYGPLHSMRSGTRVDSYQKKRSDMVMYLVNNWTLSLRARHDILHNGVVLLVFHHQYCSVGDTIYIKAVEKFFHVLITMFNWLVYLTMSQHAILR